MRLTLPDLIVIVLYLAGITIFGITFRQKDGSVRDYLLGSRSAPWWALAISIVATETSTLTIIGTPALAFAGNLTFLQLVLGYLVGRVVIVLVFLPHYFRGEYYAAYQIIERRFGAKVKSGAALIFLATRALAEGVRIAAIGVVINAVSGIPQRICIVLVMGLVVAYTFEGGMKAVIWTDVAQCLLYLGGSLAAFALLLHVIPGGWSAVMRSAAATGKFRVLDFSFSLANPAKTYTFWSGVIGGSFLTMASHGTDQTIVQRLLAAKSERESKITLLASGAVILLQFALFLILGVMLFAWHGSPAIHPGQSYDWIFPDFIVRGMPAGLRGMMIASILAIAMSNASGSLNSLSASSVVDFQQARGAAISLDDHQQFLRRARWMTLFWGGVLGALGTLRWGPMLEAGLTIASITWGSLLGIFLLAFLWRRANSFGVITGMILGLVSMMYIHFFTPLVWTWYVLVGAAITFMTGAAASGVVNSIDEPAT